MADKISQYLISLGGDATDLNAVFSGVKSRIRSEVAEIKAITEKVELFGDLKNSIPLVERSLESAKQKVTQFTAELKAIKDAGAVPLKAVKDDLAAAEKAAASATKELAKQQSQLASLGTQLARVGVDTKNLAAEQTRLATATKAAADAAAVQAAKQQLGLVTVKDTAAEAAKLQKAFDLLKASGTLSATETAAAQKLLQAELKALEGTVTKTGSALVGFGRDAKAGFSALSGPILATTAAVATLAAELKHATEAANAFENNLAKVGTVTTLGKAQLDELGNGARKLATDIGVDVNDALKSLYELIRSGVPPENALEVLRKGAEAAKAALTDTATGAKAASVLMDSFGLELKDLGPALDVVVKSAQTGGPTLQEFANNAGQLGNAARAVGADFREVSAILNVMTSASGDAAGSAQTLTRILINLNTPAVGAKLHELGIDAKSLAGIFQQLDAKGLRLNEFLELGVASAKGAAGLASLTNNAGKLPKALNDAATATDTVNKSVVKLAETQEERLARFNAALQNLQIQIGKTIGAGGGLLNIATLLLNKFTELSVTIEQISTLSSGPLATLLRIAGTLISVQNAAEKARPAVAEFHQGLIEGTAITLHAAENLGFLRSKVDLLTADLLKQADAIRESTAARIASIDQQTQLQIDALDKGLKAQEATAAATQELLRKASADKLALIASTEESIRALTEKAIADRIAISNKDADVQKKLALEVAQIRVATLTKILGDYSDHYTKLEARAKQFAATSNEIERARIAFNEGIADRVRNIRLEGLTSLQQFAEKQQEVDRLIAKGRETAATQGIAAAQKYFDKAISIAESIKGEVLSDGEQVVSAFESQKTSLKLVEKAAKAYNDELGKADDEAKDGADGTQEQLEFVKQKIIDVRAELDGLRTASEKAIGLTIDSDIVGLEDAKRKIADLVKPETKVITTEFVTKGGAPIANPDQTVFPPLGLNRGGPVRGFASGGSVFRVPGVGNSDTVPAQLPVGSFVMRKAAVQKYGEGAFAQIARGYAGGGSVAADATVANIVEYAKFILQYLREPVFDFVRPLIGGGIRRLEQRGHENDIGYAGELLQLVRDQAINYHLKDFYGRTTTGVTRIGTADLPDFEVWLASLPAAKEKRVRRLRTFARGGSVDTIPAMLTPGEVVLNPSAVQSAIRMFGGGFLDAMNQGRIPRNLMLAPPPAPRHYATGGPVGTVPGWKPGAAASVGSTTLNVTINAAAGDFNDDRVIRKTVDKLEANLRRRGLTLGSPRRG